MQPASLNDVLAHLADEVCVMRTVVAMLAGLVLQDAFHGREMTPDEREALLSTLRSYVEAVTEAETVAERIRRRLEMESQSLN